MLEAMDNGAAVVTSAGRRPRRSPATPRSRWIRSTSARSPEPCNALSTTDARSPPRSARRREPERRPSRRERTAEHRGRGVRGSGRGGAMSPPRPAGSASGSTCSGSCRVRRAVLERRAVRPPRPHGRGVRRRRRHASSATAASRPPTPISPPGAATAVAPIDGGSRAVRIAAESTWLAREASRRDLHLIHHPNDVRPWFRTRPSALTIHDLRSMAGHDVLGRPHAAYLRTRVPSSARAAAVVMTPLGVRPAAGAPSLPARSGSRARRERAGVPRGRAPTRTAPVRRRCQGDDFVYPAVTDRHKNHLDPDRGVRPAWPPPTPTSGWC